MKRAIALYGLVCALVFTGSAAPQPARANNQGTVNTVVGTGVGIGVLCLFHVICNPKQPGVPDAFALLADKCGLPRETWLNNDRVRRLGSASAVYPSQVYQYDYGSIDVWRLIVGEVPFTKYTNGSPVSAAPGTIPLLMSSVSGSCFVTINRSGAGAAVINAVFGGTSPVAAALNSAISSASAITISADDVYSATAAELDLETYSQITVPTRANVAFDRNNVTVDRVFFADNIKIAITGSSSSILQVAANTGTSVTGTPPPCTAANLPPTAPVGQATTSPSAPTPTTAPVGVPTATPIPAPAPPSSSAATAAPAPSATTLPGINNALPVNLGVCQATASNEAIAFGKPGPVQLIATVAHLKPLPKP